MCQQSHADLLVDVVVDVGVDVDLDGDVYVEVGDLASTGRPSTSIDQLHVDLHVKVHDYAHVNVNVNVNVDAAALDWSRTSGALYEGTPVGPSSPC